MFFKSGPVMAYSYFLVFNNTYPDKLDHRQRRGRRSKQELVLLGSIPTFSAVFLQALAGVSYPLTVAAAAAPTGACGKSRATPGHIATGAVLMMGVACWCKRRPRPYRQQGRSTISSKCRHRRSSRGYIAERSPRCCRRGH